MPTGLPDIIPVLACSDISAEHDFLVGVLGFTSAGLERDPTGAVVHGEVRAGDRRIWLHLTSQTARLETPSTLGAAGGGLVVHVEDVDAHFAKVKASEAEILSEPTDSLTVSANMASVTQTGTAGGSPPLRMGRPL